MTEEQLQSIAFMLEGLGLAEADIAANLERLRAGEAIAPEISQALQGMDLPFTLDPATPAAKQPLSAAARLPDPSLADKAADDAAAALAAAGQAAADDQRLQQAIADAPFESAMGRAAQMAADDSGSGLQKLHYIAGQSGGDGGGGEGDWSAMEITGLASGLAGTALGVAAPWLEQDTE